LLIPVLLRSNISYCRNVLIAYCEVKLLNLFSSGDGLQWYGHVLRKEDNDWVKKYMEYEVEGVRPRGRPKKTWGEIVEKDCQVHGLSREDAMDLITWIKQMRGN